MGVSVWEYVAEVPFGAWCYYLAPIAIFDVELLGHDGSVGCWMSMHVGQIGV